MSKLQEIMNDVAKEQYNCSWVYACTFMGAGDVENLMKKVARRYATTVAENALKRAADRARIGPLGVPKDIRLDVDKQSILSTPINTDL